MPNLLYRTPVPGGYDDLRMNPSGGASGWSNQTLRARYQSGLRRAGGLAEQSENAFLSGIEGFDPTTAMQTSANAAYEQFRPELARDLESLRGTQVGMGRLNTGFATEDEDRLIGDSLKRLEQDIAQQALQAQGLELQSTGMLGNFASEQGGRFLDLVSGGLDRKQAEKNAKKGGGIGGFLKSVGQIAPYAMAAL